MGADKDIGSYIWENRDGLYRLAYSYVRNREDALDIVSESIVKALKRGKDLQNPEAVRTWVYRVVVNTAVDYIRRNRRTVSMEELPLPDAAQSDRYPDLDLRRALSCLSESQRTVVILRYFEDMKLESIAQVLDENLSTVKSRLYQSLRVLREELTEPGRKRG